MSELVPGELLTADESVEINADRETASVTIENTGDRPSQVGSHFHFFEANPALEFDREATFGMRLDIPAGTAIRVRYSRGFPRDNRNSEDDEYDSNIVTDCRPLTKDDNSKYCRK